MKKLSDIAPPKTPKPTPEKPVKPVHPNGRRQAGVKREGWFKKHRLMLIIAGIVVIVAAAALLLPSYLLSSNDQPLSQTDKPAKVAEPVRYYSPLTGLETTKDKTTAPVMAVMIENSTEARPQSGLKEAGVVFEAIAEGGITRFNALFQEADADLIGPVRSARPYYLEWAAAFDPAFVHVGGSQQALQMLGTGRYGLNIDEVKPTIWRVKNRAAPHNAYTSTAELRKYLEAHGKTTSSFTAWERQDAKKYSCTCPEDAACDCAAQVKHISINISSSAYNVVYDWDEATNTYNRSVGGRAHFSRSADGTDTQIAPNVVIAIMVNQTLAADHEHNQITTSGNGKAYVFQNGDKVEGTWSKASPTEQIKFFDAAGTELKLNRGQVWITAVPVGKGVTWQ